MYRREEIRPVHAGLAAYAELRVYCGGAINQVNREELLRPLLQEPKQTSIYQDMHERHRLERW